MLNGMTVPRAARVLLTAVVGSGLVIGGFAARDMAAPESHPAALKCAAMPAMHDQIFSALACF